MSFCYLMICFLFLINSSLTQNNINSNKFNLGDYFNWSEKMSDCINQMQKHGLCDGSYAIVAASVLSDRFCIKGVKVRLSSQYIISCNKYSNRCNEGNMSGAWRGINETGIITQDCMPFLGDSKNTPPCPVPLSCIVANTPNKKYNITDFRIIVKDKLKAMLEVHENGPVQAEMDLYEDLMNISEDDIYSYSFGNLIGRISVKIIGWNMIDEVPYWLVMTTFGNALGRNGVIKIKFGECGIDDNFIYGYPNL